MMKILEVYQNPSTLVLIVKLLRQAFKWYHWRSDRDSLGANVSKLEFFLKISSVLEELRKMSCHPQTLGVNFQ
jgi:hypothetical protein